MRLLLLLSLTLLVLTSCGKPAPSADGSRAARRDLNRLHALFDSLYREGDASALVTLLTDSATISPIEGPDLRGRHSIETILAGFFANYTISRYSLQLEELDVFGEVAYGRGTFEWQAGPRGKALTTTHGRFAAMYRRGPDGQWRLHRLIENALPA